MTKIGQLLPLVVFTAGVFPFTAVGAQQEMLSLLELPLEQLLKLEVSSASKFRQVASEAPSSVTIITAQDIKVFGWRTLADLLGSVRGLYTTNDRNYNYLGARGFARPGDYNTRFLLLIDGVRSNDALYDQAAIGHDAAIDLDLIERVEFVPGPGSSIYGSNAFFGVINILTKDGAGFSRPQASVEVGSHGEKKASASIGVRTEQDLQLMLSASTYRRDGTDQYYPEFDAPETNGGIAQGLDHERRDALYAKAAFGSWMVFFAHSVRERGIPTASFEQAFNDPRSKTEDTLSIAALAYQSELNDHNTISARLFWGQQRYNGIYAYAEPEYINLDKAKSAWAGMEFSLLNTAWHGHKIVTGFEYQRDYRRNQFNANEFPGGSLDAPAYSELSQQFTVMDDKRDGNRAGIYIQDEITVSDDLLLNLGARYDYNSQISSAINPRLAAIYKLDAATTAKAIYGTAFRAPNAYEMYYNVPGEQKANPDLKSEKIQSRELVIERQLSPSSHGVISIFENKVTNLISQTEDPDDGMLVFRNLSSTVARGIELQYEQVTASGLKLRASQSWQRAEDDETGDRLVNSPRSLTKINLTIPFWSSAASAGLEARYVGKRLTKNGSAPGFWLANATLYSAKLIKNTEISFSVYNMFDKHYGDPGAEEHAQDVIPQDGRTFRLKLSHTF